MKGEHLRWKLWRNLVKRCLVNLYKSTKSIKTNGFNNRSSLYFHHMFQPPPARRRQELRAEIQELHRSLAEAEARYAQMERENTNAPEVTWSGNVGKMGQVVGWIWVGEIWMKLNDFYHGILMDFGDKIHFDQLHGTVSPRLSHLLRLQVHWDDCPNRLCHLKLHCLKPQASYNAFRI